MKSLRVALTATHLPLQERLICFAEEAVYIEKDEQKGGKIVEPLFNASRKHFSSLRVCAVDNPGNL